jgi:hypothetical protein
VALISPPRRAGPLDEAKATEPAAGAAGNLVSNNPMDF